MPDFSKKDLLLIAYYFPPIHSVGVLRNYYMARGLQKHFRKIWILTTENQKYWTPAPLPVEGLDISLIRTIDYRRLLLSKKRQKTAVHFSKKQKSNPFAQFLIKLNDSFPFNLLFGEGGLVYIYYAYRQACQQIDRSPISHIYSSFRPYSDHMVTYLLKRRYPHLIWLADFRDVHIDTNRQNVYWPKLQAWFNRYLLKSADLVSTVSEGLANNLQAYRKEEVYVLHNGISPIASQAKVQKPNVDYFVISYTGSIYPGHQRAELLLKVLKALITTRELDPNQFRLVYAGKDGDLWEEWIKSAELKEVFTNHGLVNLPQAHALQQRAHINLLLSWSGPQLSGILTGKFYEYLAAERPILLLINGSKDREFEKMMKHLNAGLLAYHQESEEERIKSFILEHYQAWLHQGEVQQIFNQSALAQYQWPSIIESFLHRLAQLAD